MSENAESLREQVLELASIAESCPAKFQERCFELLLEDLLYLRRDAHAVPPNAVRQVRRPVEDATQSEDETQTAASPLPEAPSPPVDESADIQESDIHVKAKNFLKKQGLSVSDLNEILYREGDAILPLYDDLKSTKMSESQIRIALLSALRTGLTTGDFVFDGEQVRTECQTRKCYDASNYTTNFKNSGALFDTFEKYDKTSPRIRLSEEGKKQLGDLVRDLA